MLKPRVGLTVLMSSPLMRLTIVVLPALSSPLHHVTGCQRAGESGCVLRAGFARKHLLHVWGTYTMSRRISFSFCLAFLMIVSRPIMCH